MATSRGRKTQDPFSQELFDSLKSALNPTQSEQDRLRQEALATLDKLGSLSVKDDSVRFEGDNLVLPARFNGDLLGAARFIEQIHEAEEEEYAFGRTFKYRPWDGAAAFQRALYRVFGTVGLGKATVTFFGKRPPALVSVAVGPNENLQVPWGEVSMPPLEAEFTLASNEDAEYGQLFFLHVTAPRRNRARLEAFFDVVQDELENRSIYRGKAFNGAQEPEFVDLSWVDESKVVYADDVLTQLDTNVWAPIRYTDQHRKLGLPIKRAILLEGPFGTGKSLAGALTAKTAIENGWTFILARPGKDDLLEVLNTAKLYAPAVVQFEDIDVVARGKDTENISKLLDALDGIGNKGNGVVALFTTNYVEHIQKAVMRPGRIDSVIHIGALDRNGTEKLIKSVVDKRILSPDVDYDVVFAEVEGFLPAFVKETTDRAVRYALNRADGNPNEIRIETDDLVNSAIGLRAQLDLMNGAKEGAEKAPTIDQAFKSVNIEAIDAAVEKRVEAVLSRTQMPGLYEDFTVRDQAGKKVRPTS